MVSFVRRLLPLLACVGMILPVSPAAGQSPSMPAGQVIDVALSAGGVLRGQVADNQGQAVPHAPVAVVQDKQIVGQTMTDANGSFEFRGLRGGSYVVFAAGDARGCRLWAPRTAPPVATAQLQMVASDTVVRGQWWAPWSFYDRVEQRPVLWYSILTALVVVPIVVITHNDDAS